MNFTFNLLTPNGGKRQGGGWMVHETDRHMLIQIEPQSSRILISNSLEDQEIGLVID